MEEQKQPNKINLLYQSDIQSDTQLDLPESPKKKRYYWIGLIILLILVGGYYLFWNLQQDNREQSNINTSPMYGGVEKTAEQKAIDEKFIQGMIEEVGSREEAAKIAIKRGWDFYYNDDLDTAMKRFNQAWLLNPNNPDVFWGFGLVLGAQEQDNEALKMFNLGLKVGPDNTMLMCNIANVYTIKAIANLNEKDFYLNKAIEHLNKANLIDSEVAYCHHAWAITLFRQGLYDEALNHVDKAVSLGGSFDPNFLRELNLKRFGDNGNSEY